MAKSKADKIIALFSELTFEEQKQTIQDLTVVFGKTLEQEMSATSAKKHELEELKERFSQ